LARDLTILIADDDVPLLASLATVVPEIAPHAQVLLANCPEDALASLREADEDAPLVVLSDHDLKASMTGIELLRAVREAREDSVRLLMSGSDPPGLAQAIERGDVHAFVSKPDVARRLEDLIRSAGP